MADLYQALAHPVRRSILRKLQAGPMSAGELAEDFSVSKPTMSRRFATLKGLVIIQFVPRRRQMLLDDRVERNVLRLMALVACESVRFARKFWYAQTVSLLWLGASPKARWRLCRLRAGEDHTGQPFRSWQRRSGRALHDHGRDFLRPVRR